MTSEAFRDAGRRYREDPSKFSDKERVRMYALFKQATSGDCSVEVPAYVALLKGAGYASWRQLAGVPREEAERCYIELVRSRDPSFAASSPPQRASSETVRLRMSDAVRDMDDAEISAPVAGRSREELVKLVESLRAQVRRLSVGHVVKEGELTRFRETMTGRDWASRWFEVVPGWLRCYRSRKRDLRLEVSLRQVVRVVAEDRGSILRVELKAPTGDDARASSKIAHLRSLRLAAVSDEDRDDWIASISSAVKAASAGDAGDQTPAPKVASELKKMKDRAAKLRPAHRVSRPSLLSTDAAEPQSYAGFVNLIGVIAVVTNLRTFMNEWRLIPLVAALFGDAEEGPPRSLGCARLFSPPWEVMAGGVVLAVAVLSSLVIELQAAGGRIAPHRANAAHVVACASSLVVPTALVATAPARPALHAAWLFAVVVAWMKHVSWAHTNTILRTNRDDDDLDDDEYPRNLTLRDLRRFYAYPTLVYQTSYPRSHRVRKRWLSKRIFELLVVVALMVLIVTQFVAPTVLSVRALDNPAVVLERLFALAIPNIGVWLLVFVAVFELWLSILAEATRFGDRLFYRDWWNASKMDEYWRHWNLPVHNWLLRHVFFPVLDLGLPKPAAMFAVFFVSASLHELLVSGSCHVLNLWVFAAMLAQMPLIALTNFLADKIPSKSRLGNVLFWISFCVIGQPLCIMIYTHQFVAVHAAEDGGTTTFRDDSAPAAAAAADYYYGGGSNVSGPVPLVANTSAFMGTHEL
ncbi:hypothetical protein CTAYLR_007027 [Chrysophaeum taylorii]|uniref:diacylglycerol O-acyltransferase n=1 Tax=Chrysophaeum taylorii TaxID=2483200 RepID=A0AAD7XHB6_9STRA|nr:hypothetical protein CTAYLR_007027 [Chrysophaeum taylorii]